MDRTGHHGRHRLQAGTLVAVSLVLSLLATVYASRLSLTSCVTAAVTAVFTACLAGVLWGRADRADRGGQRSAESAPSTSQQTSEADSNDEPVPLALSEVGRLTQSIAHDLKSPLVTAQGFLQLVRAELSQGEHDSVGDHLDAISRAVSMMELRLDTLLRVARSGELNGPWTDLVVADLIQPALDALAAMIQQRSARIDSSQSFPNLHGDRERLISVYQNLIENALKFVPETRQPQIEINWRTVGSEIVYFVRDNGTGINPSQHQRVFALFETLGSEKQGNGIGLSIVQRAIDVHQGRVWIESEGEATGTTVCFSIPCGSESTPHN